MNELVSVVFFRPILMFTEPLVLFTDIFLLYEYVIFFLYFEAYPIIFKGISRLQILLWRELADS